MTYTLARLPVPRSVWDLIAAKLRATGIYDHAIHDDADRIADLQIKLGIIAPPIETTEDPDGREDAVLYIDHGKA